MITTTVTTLEPRLNKIKDWLDKLENEEKRKIVNALKRAKEASTNEQSSKFKRAKDEFGNGENLKPILFKSERFGKERFSLEFIPTSFDPNKVSEQWLTTDEAILLSNEIKVERANYPQRLKLAFTYLARRQGIKNHRLFRYSTDGEHYTKAYPSLEAVPNGEETISFEEALKYIKTEKEGEEPPVYQTKVYRVALSSLRQSNLLAFEKCDPEEAVIPRCTYNLQILSPESYHRAKRDPNFKLLWPQRQENALFCLMEACQDLILQCSSKSLGSGTPYYATIYQREAEIGPEGLLYKGLVACGEDKKIASQKASDNVERIWTGFNTKPRALMCLHSKECDWICQLTEEA
jgi:hypothetical protein